MLVEPNCESNNGVSWPNTILQNTCKFMFANLENSQFAIRFSQLKLILGHAGHVLIAAYVVESL